MMVGAEVGQAKHDPHDGSGAARLVVRGLSLRSPDPHGTSLSDISLDVKAGEIVGVAGVAGNGQDELFAALSGEALAATDDAVTIDGRPVGRKDINARRQLGAAFVPEERLGHAAAPTFRLSDNALVAGNAVNGFVSAPSLAGGVIDRGRLLGWVDDVTKAFDVRKGPRDPAAKALSGGNLQKFVVGRDILRKPTLLVVAQPTWGVDAGAAQLIRQALVDLAKGGAAVLVISQDLDELFEISDRLCVLFHGRLSAPRPAAGLTREAVGLLMGGANPAEAA